MKSMKIAVWGETILYGGICFLAEGFREFYKTDLCVLNEEPYRYGPKELEVNYYRKDSKKVKKIINDCDILIVSATISLRYLIDIVGFKDLQSKPIAMLVGDSHYCNNCNSFLKPLSGKTEGGFNALIKETGIKVFMMPDKYHFCDDDIKLFPYFPPIKVPNEYILPKNEKTTVLHLPGSEHKQYEKGTAEILEVFEKIKEERSDIIFQTPPMMIWEDCMKLKSQCHIYVDQLVMGNDNAGNWRYKNTGGFIYDGGLAKAGIEAMHLGALTITSGIDIPTMPYFPEPPVVWVDKISFEHTLRSALNGKEMYYKLKQQNEWARKYTTPRFMARHVLRNLI